MREKILGVNIDFDYTVESAAEQIIAWVKEKKSGIVSTTNPYFVISSLSDKEFFNIINTSLLSLPDGVGILYAKYYLNKIKRFNKKSILFFVYAFFTGLLCSIQAFYDKEFGKPVTGVELVYKLCELLSVNNLNMFLLGGQNRDIRGTLKTIYGYDMAQDAASRLKLLYPKLNVIGATSQFSRNAHDDEQTIKYIQECMSNNNVNHIDILLVAYNPINQEKWIQRNANKIPATISIGVGRTFDYITDTMRPPNKLYEKLHIAWFYALIRQPWRIKRVFKTIVIFPMKIFLASIHK